MHNPGGKVKTALPPGLKGDAIFSECGQYRPLLRRWTGDKFPADFALFCGMNPSTAEAAYNDPTISREWGFATREGLTGYVKVNVGDYRATYPTDLLKPGIVPSSPMNLPTIAEQAYKARFVVVGYGKLNRALAPLAASVVAVIRQAGKPVFCLGLNIDGSPKHPLYIAKDAPFIPF